MPTESYELAPTPAPNPSLEESAKAMGIDTTKIDPTATEQTADPLKFPAEAKQRPDNIPEKFWDAEKGELNSDALLKSYTELEKKGTKPEENKTPEAPKSEAEKVAAEAATKAGLNLDDLSAAYWDQGELTEEQYASLEKGGYSRQIVDQYIEGQVLVVEREQAKAYEAAGGEDQYTSMVEWAADALDAKQQNAYNEAIASGDINKVVLAVQGLKARYDKVNGAEPSFVQGGAGQGGSDAYESAAQMKADMGDPRYKSDPAFRKRVEQKVGRSTAF
jgi:hypothetical protein